MVDAGGFGVIYKAKHALLGTVAYKELNTKKLGDRYAQFVLFELDIVYILSLVRCVHIVECSSLCLHVFACLLHFGKVSQYTDAILATLQVTHENFFSLTS